jgi:hypothetical protein
MSVVLDENSSEPRPVKEPCPEQTTNTEDSCVDQFLGMEGTVLVQYSKLW